MYVKPLCEPSPLQAWNLLYSIFRYWTVPLKLLVQGLLLLSHRKAFNNFSFPFFPSHERQNDDTPELEKRCVIYYCL